tara:strand:+ start:2013 stop:2360 length:348 start_codon:yes stop_codon:yes gene_type:complete
MTNTYTAAMCYMSDGSSRVFSVDSTDGTSTYQELTDVITGNSLGDSAQNLRIVKVMATCENFIYSAGIIVVDQQNNVVGSFGAVQPESQSPAWEAVNVPVQLNYTMKVLTTASVA